MNRSRHSSLSQTMAQIRRRYNTRSNGGNAAPRSPYTPSGMPPVADAGPDQVVTLETMVDPTTGTTTTSVTVNFDGSNSYDPDGGALTYAWRFGDGDDSTGTGEMPSHTYTTPGTYTVELTVTDNENKTDSDTLTVTVAEVPDVVLTLTGPDTVTRGDTTTYTASITPAGLTLDATPTFNWKYTDDIRGYAVRITESINATSQNPQTTTWSGTMVKSGTLEVRTTVNETEYVQSMEVAVNDRGWVTEIPLITDTTGWGTEAPREHADLGDVEYDIPFSLEDDLDIAAVSSGPNKGIIYTTALNLTAPFTVRINRHFGMAEADLPPCWVAFKEANTRYGEIEAKVKAHLGFDGPMRFNLHDYWRNQVRSGDARAGIDRHLETPGFPLSEYENQVELFLSSRITGRKAAMDGIKSRKQLTGITINYNYFVADAGDNQTVSVGSTVNFDGSASCAPAGRTIAAYAWDFGDGNTATGVQATHTYNTPGVYPVTLIATDDQGNTATDTLTLTAFQLVVDSDNTDDSLVFPDDPPSDSASGTNGEGGTDGASGASGASGARSESQTTTKSMTQPPTDTTTTPDTTPTVSLTPSTARFTYTLLPVDFRTTTRVHVDIYSGETPVANEAPIKRIDDVAGTGNTFSTSWNGTNNDGERVLDGTYRVEGIATYFDGSNTYTSSAAHTASVRSVSVSVKILNTEVRSDDPGSANLYSDTTADVDTVGHGTIGSRSNPATIRYEITGANVEHVLWRRVRLHIYKVVMKNEEKKIIEVKTINLGRAVGTRLSAYWDGTNDSNQFTYGEHFAIITVDLDFNSPVEPEEEQWAHPFRSNSHAITVYSFPVAKAGADQTIYVGDTVEFDGSGSHDPDDGTTSGAGINSYLWDYRDGTISSGAGPTPSHTFNQPGVHPVKLTVIDNDPSPKQDMDTVTINSTVEVALADPTMVRGAATAITAAITPTTYTPHRIEWVFTKEDGQGTVLSTTTRNTGTTASTTITMVDGDNPYYVEVKLYHQYIGETIEEEMVASDKKQITVTARSWSLTPTIVEDIDDAKDFDAAWGDPPDLDADAELGLLVDRASGDDYIISPYQENTDTHDDGYVLAQIDDLNGPNHGYWYVSETKLKIDLGTLINKHLKSDAPPPAINPDPNVPAPPTNPPPNFYNYNNGRCFSMALFLQAVKNHENAGSGGNSQGHFGRIVQELAKPNKDPSAAIEPKFHPTLQIKLKNDVEKVISKIHEDLDDASDGKAHTYVKENWSELNGKCSFWDPSTNDYHRDPSQNNPRDRNCPVVMKF